MADAIASAVIDYKNDFFQNLSTTNLNDDLNQSKKNSENNNPEEENKISERLEAKLSEAYGKQDEL